MLAVIEELATLLDRVTSLELWGQKEHTAAALRDFAVPYGRGIGWEYRGDT